eukprot:gb/GECH01001645.1/.p1 GENE.gb/GECH01001645.1/~~gb/GECH01001645.1/.p1  ORF type:complete len:519 (+),score=118.82 gb/GECH01001645.1/:1-1557(+)
MLKRTPKTFSSSLSSSSRIYPNNSSYFPSKLGQNLNIIKRYTSNSEKHYDIVVIGGGAGLAKISSPSMRMGHKVALCEEGRLGGTCLNRGCIPSKMLIHPADVAQMIDESDRFEIQSKGYSVKWKELVSRVNKTITDDSLSINPNIERNENVDWFKDRAKFIGERLLQIGDRVISGDKVFIAAGARPHVPNIPGLKDTPFMTSTEALQAEKQPKRMAVIGGGYIATELAHFYGSLGTELHMFVRSNLLRFEDTEVAQEFSRVFTSRYPNVYTQTVPSHISYDKASETFQVQYENQGHTEAIEVDQVLVATGVVPNSDLLNLQSAGIDTHPNGFIKVDDYLRTSASNVWAFGDIAGNYQFRHSANFEGEYLLETIIHGEQSYPIDYMGMPHAVFSNPQVAGVGETEDELIARNANYVKGLNPYASSAMGMALRSDHGFVKLLIEKGTRKILGCHIIGHEASVLLHEITPLMRLGGKLEDILYSIHIHPALSELVRNAARKARDALVASGDDVPLRLRLK